MKRFLLIVGTIFLVAALVILSVWAFNRGFILENRPGDGNAGAILIYQTIQYGVLGLIVVVLGAVGFFYRKERKTKGWTEKNGDLVKSGVMGWKAWAAILVVLGGVFGGGVYFLNGDTYFKGDETVYALRDKAGNVLFQGTMDEVKTYLAEKKQSSPTPPVNPDSF